MADALGRLKDLAWRWVIVGDGPFKRALEASLARHGIQGRTVLTGRLYDAEVHAWYEAASVFVHPTRTKAARL